MNQICLNNSKKKKWFVYTYAIRLIACHNNEDKVNPKLLSSLVKSLSYLRRTIEDILFGIGLKSRNIKLKVLIRTHLKIANRIIAT